MPGTACKPDTESREQVGWTGRLQDIVGDVQDRAKWLGRTDTLRLQGRDVLGFLDEAIENDVRGRDSPSLLPAPAGVPA